MRILDSIQNPADVKKLTQPELDDLAAEIRQFLVENVSRTGGHLGPNLGVVELTIALHRIFDSPADSLVFDTGHQSYVHKLLTGRHDFSHLRQSEGLSGYPNRAESKHDIVENSHASTALSWADGIARAKQLRRDPHCVVAVIGDGAMTGGMVWEALNNISEDPERPIVIVLNDNGRSYAPTVGGMVRRFEGARKLDAVRVNRSYEMFMEWTKRTLQDAGAPGKMAYGALHSIKRGVKDIFVDAGIFDSLGIKYVGPVDGHDVEELEQAFTLAKEYGGPVVVHAITEKGRGYKPAEDDVADRFHAIGKIHPETGLQVAPARFGWTSIFAEQILKLAYENPRIIGVTAAMLRPVGLGPLANEFPDRVIDVGIAEQHAITMAAGLGYQGMHPVVALYATFLNRGFDQMLMDVALHRAPVTFVLDRAGITGDDGPSHNGMWDLSLAAMVPGLATACPRDGERLRELLAEACSIEAPTLVRYPKGEVPPDMDAIRRTPAGDILWESTVQQAPSVAVVAVGAMAADCLEACRDVQGVNVTVIDPRWVLPISDELVDLLTSFDRVVCVEDGLMDGGVGSEIELALEHIGSEVPVCRIGIRREFIQHGNRASIKADEGMRPADIAAAITS